MDTNLNKRKQKENAVKLHGVYSCLRDVPDLKNAISDFQQAYSDYLVYLKDGGINQVGSDGRLINIQMEKFFVWVANSGHPFRKHINLFIKFFAKSNKDAANLVAPVKEREPPTKGEISKANSGLSYAAHFMAMEAAPQKVAGGKLAPTEIAVVGFRDGNDAKRLCSVLDKGWCGMTIKRDIKISIIDRCPSAIARTFEYGGVVDHLYSAGMVDAGHYSCMIYSVAWDQVMRTTRDLFEPEQKYVVSRQEMAAITNNQNVFDSLVEGSGGTVSVFRSAAGPSRDCAIAVRPEDNRVQFHYGRNCDSDFYTFDGRCSVVLISNCLPEHRFSVRNIFDNGVERFSLKPAAPVLFYGVNPNQTQLVKYGLGKIVTTVADDGGMEETYESEDGKYKEQFVWETDCAGWRAAGVFVPGRIFHSRFVKEDYSSAAQLHDVLFTYVLPELVLDNERLSFKAECVLRNDGYVVLSKVYELCGGKVPDIAYLQCQLAQLVIRRTYDSVDVDTFWKKAGADVGGDDYVKRHLGRVFSSQISEMAVAPEMYFCYPNVDGIKATITMPVKGNPVLRTEFGDVLVGRSREVHGWGPDLRNYVAMLETVHYFKEENDMDGFIIAHKYYGDTDIRGEPNGRLVRYCNKFRVKSVNGVVTNSYSGKSIRVDNDGYYEVLMTDENYFLGKYLGVVGTETDWKRDTRRYELADFMAFAPYQYVAEMRQLKFEAKGDGPYAIKFDNDGRRIPLG